jgi:hypothetical protein
LLCRHDFYWSERHRAERCRRCGKRQAAEAVDVLTGEPVSVAAPQGLTERASSPLSLDALPAFAPVGGGFIEVGEPAACDERRSPAQIGPGAAALKTQADQRREKLLESLERLVEGAPPTREQAIDAVLAVIEDAHSSEPVLFGARVAEYFARLQQARTAPDA